MARAQPQGRRWGFTLVELVLASALLVAILLIGATIAGQASSSWHHVYHDTQAIHDARKGLAAVAQEIRQSIAEVITVETDNPDADRLTYQVPVGRAGAAVLWGAEGRENWQVQVRVDHDRLVRAVLDEDGQEQEPAQVLATRVDSQYRGQKGFAVVRNGNLLTITVRARAEHGGHTWRKEVSTSVWLRNQGAAAGEGDGDAG